MPRDEGVAIDRQGMGKREKDEGGPFGKHYRRAGGWAAILNKFVLSALLKVLLELIVLTNAFDKICGDHEDGGVTTYMSLRM